MGSRFLQNHFTRAGAFYVDGVGNLAMTSNGYNVMGWQPNEDGTDVLVDTVSPLKIMSAENLTSAPEQTTKAYLDGVIDKNDSNVTSSTGRLVNISVYDKLGYSYIVQLAIKQVYDTTTTPKKPKDGEYSIEPVKLLNSDGKDLLDAATNPTGNAAKIDISGLTGNIKFNTQNGSIENPNIDGNKQANITLKISDKTAGSKSGVDAFVKDISIDLANLKMYDNKGTSTVAGHYGDVQGRNAGRKKGALSGVAICFSGNNNIFPSQTAY